MLSTKPRYMLSPNSWTGQRFVRFFRFEDLEGKPEPESWGPKYSKPPKPGKVRHVEPPTNAPSGQPYAFDDAKHRAKLKAEFQAKANADKRAWAMGLPAFGKATTIVEAYAQAMAEKAIRQSLAVERP